MTRQEKEILDKINDATKDIEVPESLQPENIQKLLEKEGKEVETILYLWTCRSERGTGSAGRSSGSFPEWI